MLDSLYEGLGGLDKETHYFPFFSYFELKGYMVSLNKWLGWGRLMVSLCENKGQN